jgi:UDP-2-acetamido-2,6-beta-L-arabino-hexul-4-ose reductase
MISSSTQEERDNLYGKSKKEGREALAKWAEENGGKFTGLIIPNVFGAFGKPFYNSFISTFCYQLTHNETPSIATDGEVKLIYVQELVNVILSEIRNSNSKPEFFIEPTAVKKVSEVLRLLNIFKQKYFDGGEIPVINDSFEHNLFNTYRSYIDYKTHFPVKFTQHTDPRGAFVEVIRLGIGGQCSFSTTVPGITRGNHYHTRKIERFAVIKGKALIQLRKIDTDEVLDFYLDGNEPAYVDMPIWYTHNIKNIGDEDLYTIFWINEAFNPEDADTYFLEV